MMAAMIWLWSFWAIMVVVNIILAGLFAGGETGIYLLNRTRVTLHVEAGQSSAKILKRFLDTMDNSLAMLLIGTNIHQYLVAFSISTLFVMGGADKNAEWYTTMLSPLLFVFKDSIPKALFQRSPEGLMTFLAWPLRFFDLLFKVTGLTWLVRGFSRSILWLLGQRGGVADASAYGKIASLLAEGQAAGALTDSQRQMAHRVMTLPDQKLSDVIRPLSEIVTVPVDCTREEFIDRLKGIDFSRLPAVDENANLLGVINVYDVLTDSEEKPPREWMIELMTLSDSQGLTESLFAMQRARRHLAVVKNSQGDILGMVTLKDLIEPIVGELEAW